MSDPVAFLAARLDEDEAEAKGPPGWRLEHWTAVRYAEKDSGRDWRIDAEPRCIVDAVARDDAAHIARHDPARVLREVAAGRAILTEHKPAWRDVEWPHDENGKGEAQVCPRCQNAEHGTLEDPGVLPEGFVTSYVLAPCPTLLAVLSVWSDHPDYDQEWKP